MARTARPWYGKERAAWYVTLNGKLIRLAQGKANKKLTDAEFQALLRGAFGHRGRHFRQVLIFLRFTGCRPGEMAALKWSDIDLDGGAIVLAEHKTARKVRKPRAVPLVPVVVKLLIHLR